MLNQINLIGRITHELELKYTASNVPVISFTIAVDRDYTTGGTREADFINIVAWRKTAEFVKGYFGKGQWITISGRLQSRKWTDNNGITRISYEVIADNVYFTGSKQTKEDNLYNSNINLEDDIDTEEDIPF